MAIPTLEQKLAWLKPTPLTDKHQKAATRVMVLLVRAQMLGELIDARAEKRHLDLRGPGVGIATPVLGDDLLLLLGSKAHARRNRSSHSAESTYVLWPRRTSI